MIALFGRMSNIAKYFYTEIQCWFNLGLVLNIIEKFSSLTERNKGKLELFLDQLCEKQEKELFKLNEAK